MSIDRRRALTLFPQSSEMYMCELESCPVCSDPLSLSGYSSGHKIVQTSSSVLEIGYWPKHCDNPACANHGKKWRSVEWQQIAPLHCSYGFDVIATIGWQRQTEHHSFERIYSDLCRRMLISETHIRHLYTYCYLPLLASHERTHWDELQRVSKETGLILSLDGLAPEGARKPAGQHRPIRAGNRSAFNPGVETPGSITPLLRSEDLTQWQHSLHIHGAMCGQLSALR